jgi:hypothetical protein
MRPALLLLLLLALLPVEEEEVAVVVAAPFPLAPMFGAWRFLNAVEAA